MCCVWNVWFLHLDVFQWWNQLSRFQRSVIYILLIIICCTVLYLLPEGKDSLIVDVEQKPIVNIVNKGILNKGIKHKETKEIIENNNNNVLEEPGNEIGMNSDHLNQIGIPPNFERHINNGMFLIINNI